VHAPRLDGPFIALAGAQQRLLWRPADLLEQPRNMPSVVCHLKLLLDHSTDTTAGPQVAWKAIRFGAMRQQVRQQPQRLFTQSTRCTTSRHGR
jgi:hypothetical protein